MLRGKRAVITGGGTGFGQALSVWLAREGVEVDFCARRADDIQKTCSIITAEGGMAKGHLCDLTLPESLSQFSSQLLTLDKPIDILILNAAQWLSGTLDDQSCTIKCTRMRLSSCNIFDDQDDKSRTHCLRLYSGWFQFRYDNGRG